MELTDNTILITGGATGIGFALATELSGKNTVIICGRRKDMLESAKKKLPGMHIRVCDLEKQNERVELAEWLVYQFPEINILVNNAGIQQDISLQQMKEIEPVRQEVEINFIAPVHLSALLVPHLKAKPRAAIINISSGLAFTPMAFMPVYCASKAALHSFTLSLRHQLIKTTVRVFEIAPPIVDTNLDKGRRDSREQSDRGITPEAFAKLALEAVEKDVFEAAIGFAENLRQQPEAMFSRLNH
jgi:uncharacterized oxidoreductase